MLYDSHAHLNNEGLSKQERSLFIESVQDAVDSGLLSYVNDVGFDLESSKMAVDHAAKYPWCYAVVGCHPHDADRFDDIQLEMIKALAKKEKAMAIGEIGLDFHYDNSERDSQRYWFRRQIQLANQLKMPIVIHEREAGMECMDILKEEGAFSDERLSWFPKRKGPVDEKGNPTMVPDARVLLHCFSGSKEMAEQYVKLGATLSIAGPVTYKNARKTVEVVEAIPLEFLLIETDSPYLTPEPFRGRKNRPALVEYTAKKVAEIKGIDFETVAKQTCINAKNFFGI